MATSDISSIAKSISSALSSLRKCWESAKALNEEIMELAEQIQTIEKLPESLAMCQLPGWRPKLLTKMRTKESDYEEEYQSFTEAKIPEALGQIAAHKEELSSTSLSFTNDIDLIEKTFQEIQRIASANSLLRFNPETPQTRSRIPVLSFEVETALKRLHADLRTLYDD